VVVHSILTDGLGSAVNLIEFARFVKNVNIYNNKMSKSKISLLGGQKY